MPAAERARPITANAMVPRAIAYRDTPDDVTNENQDRAEQAVAHLQGGIASRTVTKEVRFYTGALTQRVEHGLGRVPEGFRVVRCLPAALVFEAAAPDSAIWRFTASGVCSATLEIW